jgi:hypothetical protein
LRVERRPKCRRSVKEVSMVGLARTIWKEHAADFVDAL